MAWSDRERRGKAGSPAGLLNGDARLALVLPMLPIMELSVGETTLTVSVGGAGDVNAPTGAVTFTGAIGDFFINVTTGLSKPILGTEEYPSLDLSSVNVSSSAGGTNGALRVPGPGGVFLLGVAMAALGFVLNRSRQRAA